MNCLLRKLMHLMLVILLVSAATMAKADNQKDKPRKRSSSQNQCGGTGGCSVTWADECVCESCTPTKTVQCPCVEKVGDTYVEVYNGSCVECEAGTSVEFPIMKVQVTINGSVKWYYCQVGSDPSSSTYEQGKQCGR